ncbi:LysE family translocator [Afifella sp. IM 167]|uniref:LysE family translocator n=1 Tax=Afifella sp. IM 167 TaxID=2033586 RepID=UPI001CCFD1A9|nr:LysE family translocator [Afifella sp. IM 167]MBZ8134402.1 amino acid transporter [Afifella sp. IM 167]
MPSSDLLVPFFLASAVFACVPGPGMLYAAAQTLAGGRRAGWLSCLGFHIAGIGHVAAAALGVSALLQAVPAAFVAMKIAGAACLVAMGLRYLLRPAHAEQARSSAVTARRALRGSILAEALNPKSALFYLAFLPQFVDPAAALPLWAQISVLGLLTNAMFTLTDMVLIEASHFMASRLRATVLLARLRRLGGGVLVMLGLHLAFARNP